MRLAVIARVKYRQTASLIVLSVGCLVLASCGMFGRKEKQPLYYSAVESSTLEIPAGLNRPSSSGALVIVTPMSPLPQRKMQTVPPRVNNQSATDKDSTGIRWSAEGAFLFVHDTQASVLRRLGIVIKRSGLSISELGTKDGYSFEYWHDSKDPDEGFFSKLAFWRENAPNYSGSYQAVTQSDGENTRIFIKNSDGSDAAPDVAEHLLVLLMERLG